MNWSQRWADHAYYWSVSKKKNHYACPECRAINHARPGSDDIVFRDDTHWVELTCTQCGKVFSDS